MAFIRIGHTSYEIGSGNHNPQECKRSCYRQPRAILLEYSAQSPQYCPQYASKLSIPHVPSSLDRHILIAQAGELGGAGLRDSSRTVDVEHRMIVTRLASAIESETGEALDRLPYIEMGTIK
jgi:hypothetical protein